MPRRAPSTTSAERLAHQRPPPRRSRPPPWPAPLSGSRSSRRSPPLNRPPMIGTRPRSKLSIDRSADSTLVAFESLTKRTPSTSADQLHRVLEAAERRRPPRSSPPASRRPARRRSPPPSRRRPGAGRAGESASSGTSGVLPSAPALDNPAVLDRRCLRRSAVSRANSRFAARAVPRQLQHRRIVGVDHRPVAGCLVLEDARLRRRVRLDGRMPIEMVGREVQHHRDPRMERVDLSRAESCWSRRRAACRASSRRPARSAARRCCRRPSP